MRSLSRRYLRGWLARQCQSFPGLLDWEERARRLLSAAGLHRPDLEPDGGPGTVPTFGRIRLRGLQAEKRFSRKVRRATCQAIVNSWMAVHFAHNPGSPSGLHRTSPVESSGQIAQRGAAQPLKPLVAAASAA